MGGRKKNISLINDKQLQVLELLITGHNIGQIAETMELSRRMVDVYIHQIKNNLGASTREQAVAIAIKKKILKL